MRASRRPARMAHGQVVTCNQARSCRRVGNDLHRLEPGPPNVVVFAGIQPSSPVACGLQSRSPMNFNRVSMGLVLAAITSGLTLAPEAGASPQVLNEFKSAKVTVATPVALNYWSSVVSVPQFDTSKGELVAVDITLSGQAYNELNFTPVNPLAWTYVGHRTVFKALNPADGTPMITGQVNDFLHINSDLDSYVAGGGQVEARTMLFASDNDAFEGTGSVNITLESTPLMWMMGSSGAGSDMDTWSNVILNVTYYYKNGFGLDP